MTVTRSDYDDAALRAWWEDAYSSSSLRCDTLFQSLAWNRNWYEHFVRDDPRRELYLLKIESDREIIAVAPMFLQIRSAGPLTAWRYLLFLGDRLAQYTDLITLQAETAPLWHAILQYLEAELPGSWIELHDVLPASTARQADMQAEKTRGETYLRIPLAKLDSTRLPDHCVPHMRREILRARKTFSADSSWRWEAVSAPGEDLVSALMDLNRARFGEASWFAEKLHRDFFNALSGDAGEELLFTVLRHNDDIAHVMVSYSHGTSMLYVLSGMDERFRKYSPGSMNLDRSICHAAEHGYTYFDFLRGDEKYKQEFRPEQRTSEHWTLQSGGPGLRYRIARTAQNLRRGEGERTTA